MHNVKELKVWQKAMTLVVEVYKASACFPKEEVFGLTYQIRKSAVSIPSNIAEGAGRNTKGEFSQFLGISSGSAYELMTQIILANQLGFMKDEVSENLLNQIEQIQKMTYNLQKTLG